MPLRRKYVRSCASNSRSMRSTLFNSRIREFSTPMSSLNSPINRSRYFQRQSDLALKVATVVV